MTHHPDHHDARPGERVQSLGDARAALRAEHEQIAAERAEAERLLGEAREAHRAATRERDRARRIAQRFVRWVKHRHGEAREQIYANESHLVSERDRIETEFKRLIGLRSEFQTAAADTRDRLRDAWAVVETQQQRAASDWTEAERYFSEQSAQLEVRASELARREKSVADQRARSEAESVGLREETAALEARVANARTALAELEAHRERVRAELLGTEPPPELAGLMLGEPGDLADREVALARDKTAVAALKTSLQNETAELADRKRVIAEQYDLLADARAQWQTAERQTVIEMEEMARDLKHREADLDTRENRLIRADVRRRDDAYDLWRLRLRLEAWQSKLTTFEARWQGERELREQDLERRTTTISRRERELEETFARWEKARESERERLRAELEYWSSDREQFTKAAAEFDLQRQLHDAELSTCAARALAAEELVAEAMQDSGSDRIKRRLEVLRKRWERLFDQKVKEIDNRRAEAACELAALAERYRKLHAVMTGVFDREAAANKAAAVAELDRAVEESTRELSQPASNEAALAELVALREEVERLAGILLNMEMPEHPGLPEQDLPWGAEEELTVEASVFQFENNARAA